MGIQNLRNKYREHPVIIPLIQYCDENEISFELIKETREVACGFKGFKYTSSYYLIIGDKLLQANSRLCHWNNLFELIVNAYKYLEIDYPESLIKAAIAFRKTDLIF